MTAGATRSSWPPAWSARSPPASPTVARSGSGPPSSRPERRSEDFDFDHQRSLKRETIAHLGTLDFVAGKDNVVFLGHRGPARRTWPRGSGSAPVRPGTGWPSPPPPSGWPAWARPISQGRLHAELTRLGRVPLLIIDEVGYIPFDGEAANLFFQLISSRYERATVIVTSNKPFGRWGQVSAIRWWPPP